MDTCSFEHLLCARHATDANPFHPPPSCSCRAAVLFREKQASGSQPLLRELRCFPLNIITTSGQTVFIGGTPRPRKFSNLPVALEYTPSIVREVRIVLLGFEGGVLFKIPRDPRTEQGRGQQGTEGLSQPAMP